MKRLWTVAAAYFLSIAAPAAEHHWAYEGPEGPDSWGKMEGYSLCSSGKNQSPVDLRGAVAAKLAPLQLKYESYASDILNNGHTVQVNYAPGSTLVVDSYEYHLKQFHFHAPSENLIDGKQFPLEVHFVHADSSGNLAVIAVFFDEGAANAALNEVEKNLPMRAGDRQTIDVPLAAMQLMPRSREYYRFSGSLTTPPCSEGVNWLVLKNPITASAAQIEKLHTAFGPSNARPVQPLNARVIVR